MKRFEIVTASRNPAVTGRLVDRMVIVSEMMLMKKYM